MPSTNTDKDYRYLILSKAKYRTRKITEFTRSNFINRYLGFVLCRDNWIKDHINQIINDKEVAISKDKGIITSGVLNPANMENMSIV